MPLTEENTEIIVAGPGVGKTTEILNRIEQALNEGVPPLEIAFFSFSNTAVNEGLDRIVQRMKYTKNQFRYFKTLHAMAFSLLGLDSKQIISAKALRQFAQENDLRLGSTDHRTGVVRYQTPDSVLLSQIDSARLMGMSVRDYFIKQHIDTVPIAVAEELATKYQQFKIANGFVDFTDMILYANATDFETPHFQYMFIDEAQDLSAQQWKFVDKLADNVDNVVIVGDEKQAIAEFAGADVDSFLALKGKISTLDKSFRVPRKIYSLARKVEKYMIKTRNAMWYPRAKEFREETNGEVIRVSNIPIREMAHGTWLLLTRTNSQLEEFKTYLMQYCDTLPAFFTIDGQPPIDTDVFKAIQIFDIMNYSSKVTKYDIITISEEDTPAMAKKKMGYVLLLKKFMSSRAPGKAELDTVFMHRFNYRSWFDAFDRIPVIEKKYINTIKDAYINNPDSFNKANIKLSTIHSAKGMEADNVILYTVLTKRVYEDWVQYRETNDTEAKVLFVGITRAKRRLYLLGDRRSQYSYKEMLE